MAGVPGGVSGASAPRPLEIASGLFAIVADAPSGRYSETAINRRLANLDWVSRLALAHEAVVEHFIDAAAVLPMKLFTIFANDARAIAHLGGERSRLAAAARRVGRHDEWGLRVVLAPARTERGVRGPRERVSEGSGGIAPGSNEAPARTERGVRGPRRTSGMAYLTQKKVRREASLELVGQARQRAASLYRRLARHARLARRRPELESSGQAGSLLLDAAFLVPRGRAARFRALTAREARTLAPLGLTLTLTGPWPAYSFVQE
jgi:hypothetical protein